MARRKQSVLWSAEAERDVTDIWNYWAREASPAVADDFLRAIGRAIARLQEWPFSGRKRDELIAGLRSAGARPNVIFYRPRERQIEIVRVLDGRRDIDAIFTEPD
jgi:toxin ParE1/3/4